VGYSGGVSGSGSGDNAKTLLRVRPFILLYNDINSHNKPSFCGLWPRSRLTLRWGHVFLVFVHTRIHPVVLQSPTRNAQCLEIVITATG